MEGFSFVNDKRGADRNAIYILYQNCLKANASAAEWSVPFLTIGQKWSIYSVTKMDTEYRSLSKKRKEGPPCLSAYPHSPGLRTRSNPTLRPAPSVFTMASTTRLMSITSTS